MASGPQPCPTAQLSAAVSQPSGAAGEIYYSLVLRNTGSTSCSLDGYPGVSFVAGPDNAQVGASADRLAGPMSLIVLSPGGEAQARLGISDAANFGPGCGLTTTDGLRIYPPNQTAFLIVTHSDQGCSNKADVTLHVGPLVLAAS